jgi:hypothetical protein
VLLQRWLKLYFTYSMTRRGDTFQRYLQRSKTSEPSAMPAWYKRLWPRKVTIEEQNILLGERTKKKSNTGLWIGLVITSLLAGSTVGSPNFGFVPLNGVPNGITNSSAEALGYDLAKLFLGYIPFVYFAVRYVVRYRRGN